MKKLRFLLTVFACMLCINFMCCEVNAKTNTKVHISKTKATMYVGNSTTLKIKGTNKKVKWSSSKKSVATVNSKGKVTAKKKGTAVISAKVSKKTYKCTVTVKNPSISKTKVTLVEGATVSLKLQGTKAKKWSSSDKSVATVNSKGKVTAKKVGIVTISCKAVNGKTYKSTITVNKRVDYTPTYTVTPTPAIRVEDKDDIPPAHVHLFRSVEEIEVSCEKDGYTKYVCDCGKFYEVREVALGHKLEEKERVEPSCTKEGYAISKCSKCGHEEKVILEMIPHEYEVTEEVKPTCTESGSITSVCKNCEKTYVKYLYALGHDMIVLKDIKKTCTTKREYSEKCANCNFVYIEMGNVYAPHTWVETEKVKATCEEDGYLVNVCEVCKKEIKITLPKSGHCFATSTQEPTKDTSGYTSHLCTSCMYIYVENYTLPTGLKGWTYELKNDCIYLKRFVGEQNEYYVPEYYRIEGKSYKVVLDF